jgi:DNA repair protein RecO (recombination protein O)
MLYCTRGIVLHTVKYTDTSIIARIFTEAFGLQSYIIQGARRKKSAVRSSLFQPMALLELIVYRKEKKSLHRLKEAGAEYAPVSIPSDVSRQSIIFFMSEILNRSIKEQEQNPMLFCFIHDSVIELDKMKENCANFHLHFMVHLSRHLGFFPNGGFSEETPFFDLQNGTFTAYQPAHENFLSSEQGKYFGWMMNGNYETTASLALSGSARKELMRKLILYYEFHLGSSCRIRSHKILEEVLA